MRNFIKGVIIIIFVYIIIIIINKFYLVSNVYSLYDNGVKCYLKYKGLDEARDITEDSSGKLYIAFNDKIQCIERTGKSYILLKNKNMNISSIECDSNKIYISSGCSIYCYSIDTKQLKEIISSLPNLGDYKNSLIKVSGNYLYITIGAATNSGVVGEDNKWVKDTPYNFDITPYDITLKGKNFGAEKTGAFAPYRTQNIKGQIVPGHFPGNASVIIYNLKNGNMETFAWGIRSINGMDFTSDGRLISTVGGMEDRGLRPIKGDSDYIYEIKKGKWYGWPDYSGGDPVTSPKFGKDASSKTQFILDVHPTMNPPAPLYQYKSLGVLGTMTVDKSGNLYNKNDILFYDKAEREIRILSNNAVMKQLIKFDSHTDITSIKFVNGKLAVLDGGNGFLYFLSK